MMASRSSPVRKPTIHEPEQILPGLFGQAAPGRNRLAYSRQFSTALGADSRFRWL
jgi:hypothetical protein